MTAVPSAASAPASPSTNRLAVLVAKREILAQVRSRSFWISTGVLLALVLGAIVGSSFFGDVLGKPPKVAAVPQVVEQVEAARLDMVEVPDRAAAEQRLRDRSVGAAVVLGDDGGLLVLGLDSAPTTVAQLLATVPPVGTLDPPRADEGMRMFVALAFGLVFMMAAATYGMTIAQNTVTEKQTRVVEILLSAVPARALFTGKIAGISLLALGQTTALAVVSVVGLTATDRGDLLDQLGAPVVWFVVFFIIGFVLLASMFAAAAALVSRQEDLSAVVQPMVWLIMLPYFAVLFFNGRPTVLTVLSYVPFSAPVGMPVRLFFGDAAVWEPLVSLALLVLTAAVVVAVGARVYQRSVLRMGTRVRLTEVLRAER
ncbi:MAG: ABC transporter permease [Micrococcales bacterium]|nr:ABC transporter permease [Micrococcales bacterium]